MAAPSSKSSPSNQKMHDSESAGDNARLKDPPPSVNTAAAASSSAAAEAAPTKAEAPLTYRASETSESYRIAKQLLNSDDFEGALNVIEEALHKTTKDIRANLGLVGAAAADNTTTTTNANDVEADLETEVQMHEALGPLHYLYGTTLLYSLEEVRDDGNGTEAAMMMTTEGVQASTTAAAATSAATTPAVGAPPAPDTSNNPWAHLGAASTAKTAAVNEEPPSTAAVPVDADPEDIHIAWENLEAARAIVEKILLRATNEKGGNCLSEHYVAKLQLDLAQIHLREGDLQRINGNYTSAVGDYSTCLETLLQYNGAKDEENNVRDLDRKIADTQYNLGLAYLTSSSDLQKEVAGADNANATSSPKEKGEADQHRRKATILATEHCQKGIQQHFDCARTFCKILAKLCGVDPETILSQTERTGNNDATDDAKKAPAGLKTTGLDDDDNNARKTPGASTHNDTSKTLNIWRKSVTAMVQSRIVGGDDALGLLDIVQVLDEIQETIDEAERSQEAVFQAVTIRVKAQQAAAGLGGDEGAALVNPDGSTTTIGFGPGASSVAAYATATTSGTQQANAGSSKLPAAAEAKPMMVVKKKKKRPAVEPTESDDAEKRAKTAP